MKKIALYIVISMILLAICFSSCQNTTNNQSQSQSTDKNTNVPSLSSRVYGFNSYEELSNVFSENNNNIIKNEKALYGDKYETFVNMLTEDETISIPKLNGQNMDLRNRDGYDNIIILVNELYRLPWIWYYCLYNGENVNIHLTYLSLFDNNENNLNEMNFAELLKSIMPEAPNVDNYSNYSNYKNAFVSEIQLSDKTVSALVYEYNDNTKKTFLFIYNELCVLVDAESSVLTNAFWERFSIESADYSGEIK